MKRRARPERIGLREIVEEYAEELERTFYESDHLDAVAERLGMSRRRFTQLFREVSGKTWLEAVRDLRLAHAQHLLRETNRTVASIAFECGFADLSSFYRAFSRQEGVSPLKWRETQRPS